MFVNAGIDQGQIVAGQRFILIQFFLDIPADLDGFVPQGQGPFCQGAELLDLILQRQFHRLLRGAMHCCQVFQAGIGGKGRQHRNDKNI